METFLPIPGYSRYTISPSGQVYNTKRCTFLKPQPAGTNTIMYTVNIADDRGFRKSEYVHRLVAMTYIPNPNNLKYVNHIDGNKTNNHVSNLEWFDKNIGWVPPPQKLDPETVIEIFNKARHIHDDRKLYNNLAKQYGVQGQTIRLIVNGGLWSSITGVNKQN